MSGTIHRSAALVGYRFEPDSPCACALARAVVTLPAERFPFFDLCAAVEHLHSLIANARQPPIACTFSRVSWW